MLYTHGVKTGRLDLNRLVRAGSTAAAKIFGLFPRKGTIAPGSDADIVVFDPDKKIRISARTLHMKVDYNPYEGREVTGATDTVVSRGRVIVDGGTFTGRVGSNNKFTFTGGAPAATVFFRVAAIDPSVPTGLTAWSAWVAGTLR